jgi:hypothetical protein
MNLVENVKIKRIFCYLAKGQEISERNCGASIFQNNNENVSLSSAPASKRWLDQKNKVTL